MYDGMRKYIVVVWYVRSLAHEATSLAGVILGSMVMYDGTRESIAIVL